MNFFLEGWLHPKNLIGLELMRKNGLELDFDFNYYKRYDCIINTTKFKEYLNYKGKLIYGPHISHPDVNEKFTQKRHNIYFNCLSQWNVELAKLLIKKEGINFVALPFAVDTDKFYPKVKAGKPVIYLKKVDKNRLNDVISYLKDDFLIFDYHKGYQENVFKSSISEAPYCIWIGCHESQGFAFQETLSCNTPIFVINVRSMREESNSAWVNYMPHLELSATSASYFDDSCGLITYPENWKEDWEIFRNMNNFKPREFIINNLSPQACNQIWHDAVDKMLS